MRYKPDTRAWCVRFCARRRPSHACPHIVQAALVNEKFIHLDQQHAREPAHQHSHGGTVLQAESRAAK